MVAAVRAAVASRSALARDVDFAADDRLDPLLDRRIVELHGAEEVAVVGQRDRRHSILDGPRDHGFDLVRTVEEAEVAVKMEVDKFTHVREPSFIPIRWCSGVSS